MRTSRTHGRVVGALLTLLLLTSIASAEGPSIEAASTALVQIRVRIQPYSLVEPWKRELADSNGGSGFIIDGHRIITAAHVVASHVAVEVKRNGSSRWHQAHVDHVSDASDLAILSVPNDQFFAGSEALSLGEEAAVQQSVLVLGFPIGGRELSVTRGIVSRIELGPYVHSAETLLIAQIDAAINGGNSGGPVIAQGQVVGVAIQSWDDAENVGYMAPVSVLRHFLKDAGDGELQGVPRSGILYQALESDLHREFLGLRPDDGGVLILHADWESAAAKELRRGDVLLTIDGSKVERDGRIELAGTTRVDLDHAIQRKQVGDAVDMVLLRDGKPHTAQIRVSRHEWLVEASDFGRAPTYRIFGGVVFQSLTVEYLQLFDDTGPPPALALPVSRNLRSELKGQVVFVSSFLESQSNLAYRWAEDEVVDTVNGTKVRDIQHLSTLLDSADARWVEITMENGGQLVFDRTIEKSRDPQVLARHGVMSDRSADLSPAVAGR